MREKRFTASKYIRHYTAASVVVFALVLSQLALNAGALLNLLAASISSFTGATTTVFFTPYGDATIAPGDAATIDITLNTKVPIDALGADIYYPKDSFEIVSVSKEKSFFDLWTEDTVISENSGEIHFSGGTTRRGGLMGTGTVLTIMVRAKLAGSAQMELKNVQVYPSNDSGKPVDTLTRPLTYTIEEPRVTTPSGGVISGGAASISAPLPNLDLNGDGKVNLVDLSIFTFKMLGVYNPRYDFNINGSVGLDDLSILLYKM